MVALLSILSALLIGTNVPASVYVGTNAVQSIYAGTNLVWSAGGGDVLDGLVAWWKLDDGSGTNPVDSAGTFTGTFHGSPTWTNLDGHSGLSFVTASKQKVKTEFNTTLSNFTVCFWFWDDGNSVPFERLVDKKYATGFWLGRDALGGNSWGGGVKEGPPLYGVFFSAMSSVWNHMTVTRDGADLRYYKNGLFATNKTCSAEILSNAKFTIGGIYDADTDYFGGIISDVRIYTNVLTPEQTYQIWNATK